MTDVTTTERDAPPLPPEARRAVFYLIDDLRGEYADYMGTALSSLRDVAEHLVAIVDRRMGADDRARLGELVDEIVTVAEDAIGPLAYPSAVAGMGERIGDFDEVVFTGNSWYGPVHPLTPVVQRMADRPVDMWQMTDNIDGPTEGFPEEGFPDWDLSWVWLALRRDAIASREWRDLWRTGAKSQQEVADALAAAGFTAESAFPARGYPRGNPVVFAPDLLLEDGFPFLGRAVFAQFPPFLDRHAVLGRRLLHEVEAYGFDLTEAWQDLARTVPPNALNAIAGMLEVLPDAPGDYDPERPFRIAVIAYVPDVDFVDEMLARLSHLPSGFDLYITTGDGGRARAIEMKVAAVEDPPFASFETRVSWVKDGRDKASLLIACRDVVLGDKYDLMVKIHGRVSQRKTQNMQEYTRRYLLDNLLGGDHYVRNILALFQKQPGLGLVFPPMIHIGNAIIGRGWGAYRSAAEELCERLGVRVPLDRVSPLAPFGGMWIGRPEAIRRLAEERWTGDDYGKAGRRRYVELGRVQERLVALVAAEAGFHSRTVLTHEHASISHTSLEFKVDQMSSTTRGYPVEQIRFLHRLGSTGHGGVVALTRMYLRNNHPRLARALLPLYRLAFRGFGAGKALRTALRPGAAGDSREGTS